MTTTKKAPALGSLFRVALKTRILDETERMIARHEANLVKFNERVTSSGFIYTLNWNGAGLITTEFSSQWAQTVRKMLANIGKTIEGGSSDGEVITFDSVVVRMESLLRRAMADGLRGKSNPFDSASMQIQGETALKLLDELQSWERSAVSGAEREYLLPQQEALDALRTERRAVSGKLDRARSDISRSKLTVDLKNVDAAINVAKAEIELALADARKAGPSMPIERALTADGYPAHWRD